MKRLINWINITNNSEHEFEDYSLIKQNFQCFIRKFQFAVNSSKVINEKTYIGFEIVLNDGTEIIFPERRLYNGDSFKFNISEMKLCYYACDPVLTIKYMAHIATNNHNIYNIASDITSFSSSFSSSIDRTLD